MIIAGNAAPNAKVEIVSGARIIGSTVAGADGDFAIIVEGPLAPGGHQLVLRSTTPDNAVTTSLEAAVVTIPAVASGQVLVVVEQQREPSKPATLLEAAFSDTEAALAEQLKTAARPAPAKSSPSASTDEPEVVLQAVEIEGRKIFLAGVAVPDLTVLAYVDDVLLGETKTSPAGRFLLEAERDIPVGEHIIRIDVHDPDGKVIAFAKVPFDREPGGTLAAVASTVAAAPDAINSTPGPIDQIGESRLLHPGRFPETRECRACSYHTARRHLVADFAPCVWPGRAVFHDLSRQ